MCSVELKSLAVVAAAILLPVLCSPASAAEAKRPAAPVAVPPPSGAEVVGRLLKEQNGPSDPDVPLPRQGLGVPQDVPTPLSGPQIYGRREDGGGVLGLKFPIPAGRAAN
jgi:hypothetical protein